MPKHCLQKATVGIEISEWDEAAAPLYFTKDSLQEATLGSVVSEIGWWQLNTTSCHMQSLLINMCKRDVHLQRGLSFTCPSFCIP